MTLHPEKPEKISVEQLETCLTDFTNAMLAQMDPHDREEAMRNGEAELLESLREAGYEALTQHYLIDFS